MVELAVGVVIGASFGSVVTAFTKAFLDPLIKLVSGGSVAGAVVLRAASPGKDAIVIDYGLFITANLTFLLTALVVYFFVVVLMNAAMSRLKSAEIPPVAQPSNEEKLLAEIRDALRAR